MNYENLLKTIKHIDEKNILSITKNKDPEISIKEILSNAFEAIKLKNKGSYSNGKISIQIYINKNLANIKYVDYLIIKDNGIGFDQDNFKRFSQFINKTKGFGNKGTGRFSVISLFKAHYSSIFIDNETNRKKSVEFDFNKENPPDNMFCANFKYPKISNEKSTGTMVTLYPISLFQYDISHLKEYIYQTFLLELLLYKEELPLISMEEFEKDTNLNQYQQTLSEEITLSDLPVEISESKTTIFEKIVKDNELISQVNSPIDFNLYSIKSKNFKKNEIILTANNMSVERQPFYILSKDETIEGNKYILLVQSLYLDNEENTNNERTKFNLKTKREAQQLAKEPNFHEFPFILRDDLDDALNEKFAEMNPEIQAKKEEKNAMLERMKEKYLISDEIFRKAKEKLSPDATMGEILKTYYTMEGEILAENTLQIEEKLSEMSQLSTLDSNSEDKLKELTDEVTKLIPMQNRTALAQYVTRRRLILEWFEKLLEKSKNDSSILEKDFHNLFLKQHTANNSTDSNLWILNEDFIYFPGYSEEKISDVAINGSKVFKEEFNDEEERYLTSLGENRKLKRPDILLFPEENKCIIIEFKKTNENISNHLNQISKYASLILNYSNAKFEFKQFYGYLVGEAIEAKDVRAADSDFIPSYYNDYLFRPNKKVASENEAPDGNLYTEVLKYSSLLKRAKLRNKIFIDKLNR